MINKSIYMLINSILLITVTIACTGDGIGQEQVTYKSLKDVSDAAWKKLNKKKIYFGHQSVGYNILEGVQDIIKVFPQIKLNIVDTTNIEVFKAAGVFAHSEIGQNTNPESKIDDFRKLLGTGIGGKADAAALKLCFVDITSNTDAQMLFDDYKNAVIELKKAYPDLIIIHFTEPLTRRQTGWKATIKKIIGRSIGGVADNMKRNEYNELLVKEFQGKDPILDIAKIESTHLDGTRSSFKVKGKTYYSLAPEFTNDGGHLNELGRKQVAEQLLLLLVNLD